MEEPAQGNKTAPSRLRRGAAPAKPTPNTVQTTIHAGKLVKPQKTSNQVSQESTQPESPPNVNKNPKLQSKLLAIRNILEEKTQVVKDHANVLNASHQDNFKTVIYETSNDVDENILCDVCLCDEYEAADPNA